MKINILAPRGVALLLVSCLALPPPAYALRPQQKEDPSQLVGLEEAIAGQGRQLDKEVNLGRTRRQFLQISAATLLGIGVPAKTMAQEHLETDDVSEWVEVPTLFSKRMISGRSYEHLGPEKNSIASLEIGQSDKLLSLELRKDIPLAEYSSLAGWVPSFDRFSITLSSKDPITLSLKLYDPFENQITQEHQILVGPEPRTVILPVVMPISPSGEGLVNDYREARESVVTASRPTGESWMGVKLSDEFYASLKVSADGRGILDVHRVAWGRTADLLSQRQAWKERKIWKIGTGVVAVGTGVAAVATSVAIIRSHLHWRPIRQALRRFDKPDRQTVRVQISRILRHVRDRDLANILREETLPTLIQNSPTLEAVLTNLQALAQFVLQLKSRPVSSASVILEEVVPMLAGSLNTDQLTDALAMAGRLAGNGVNPRPILQNAIPAIVNVNPSIETYRRYLRALEQFADWLAAQKVGYDTVLQSADHEALFEYVVPAVVQVSPTPELFQTNLQVLQDFLVQFTAGVGQQVEQAAEWGRGPQPLIQHSIPAVAISQASSSPESFRANLQATEGIVGRLLGQKVNPNLVLRHGIPAVAHMSSTPELFRRNLEVLEGFVGRVVELRLDLDSVLGFGVLGAARVSSSAALFQANLQVIENFVVQLVAAGNERLLSHYSSVFSQVQTPEQFKVILALLEKLSVQQELEWGKVSSEQLATLGAEAVRLTGQGVGYRVQVVPERGHTQQVSREETNDLYGRSYTAYEDVYVVDAPQEVQLVSGGDVPVFTVQSWALSDKFFAASGVLQVVAEDYPGRRLSYRDRGMPPQQEQRDWISRQRLSQGVAFDFEGIGVLPHYYPLTALGERVVLRVYEEGRERTLVLVNTILVRGEIGRQRYSHGPRLLYEVFPRTEFDAMLVPDDLTNWEVPSAKEVSVLFLDHWQGVPHLTTMEHLAARNWVWRSLGTDPEDLPQPDALARINNLKQRVPWLLDNVRRQPAGRERWDWGHYLSPISLYALGSWVWKRSPRDLDVVVLMQGEVPYEVWEPKQVEGLNVPLHIRTVGVDTLRRALGGEKVENAHRIRLEAMVLYGSAVLLAGYDPFSESRPPYENLPKLAQHYRGKAKELQSSTIFPELVKEAKRDSWMREAATIEKFSTGLEEVQRLDEAVPLDGVLVTRDGMNPVGPEGLPDYAQADTVFVSLLAGVANRWQKSIEEQGRQKEFVARVDDQGQIEGLSKVLIPLSGVPGFDQPVPAGFLSIAAAQSMGWPVVGIVRHQMDLLIPQFNALSSHEDLIYAVQENPSAGTGDALWRALAAGNLRNARDTVLVITAGDQPLFDANFLRSVRQTHTGDVRLVLGTARQPTQELAKDKGRIVRANRGQGDLLAIIEQKDIDAIMDGKAEIPPVVQQAGYTSGQELNAITEVNTGVYAVRSGVLQDYLGPVTNDNAQKQFYATDMLANIVQAGGRVVSVDVPLWKMPDLTRINDLPAVIQTLRDRAGELDFGRSLAGPQTGLEELPTTGLIDQMSPEEVAGLSHLLQDEVQSPNVDVSLAARRVHETLKQETAMRAGQAVAGVRGVYAAGETDQPVIFLFDDPTTWRWAVPVALAGAPVAVLTDQIARASGLEELFQAKGISPERYAIVSEEAFGGDRQAALKTLQTRFGAGIRFQRVPPNVGLEEVEAFLRQHGVVFLTDVSAGLEEVEKHLQTLA